MNRLVSIIKKNWQPIVLFLAIIPTFVFLIHPGFFPMQDDLQALRIHQMDKCFQDWQIPCRWVPDMGYKYGYPQFQYYPPSVYYLGELIHLSGVQFIDTVKILFILGFIASSFSMYLLLQALVGRNPALVGALLYSYVPYKAVEVYVRGAMSEFWALVFFPLVFWSILKVVETKRLRYMSLLAFSVGLLLLTHNLMSMIFLPIASIWGLTLVFINKNSRVTFLQLLAGAILGISLAAFFTLPLILEKPYVHTESLLGGYFDYRQHFVSLQQLFLSNNFGYGSSVWGLGDDLALSTGIVHWVVGLISVILAVVYFKKDKKIASLIFVVAIAELAVLFLMHERSSFIWSKIPILSYLQFPWRFMAVSIFLLSLLSGLGLHLLQNINLKYKQVISIVIAVLVIALHGNFFKPLDWIDITDQEKFSGDSWQKQLTISIYDYLPIYAKFPPIAEAPEYPEILNGEVKVISYQRGSNFQTEELEVLEDSIIRLPIFDFPGMQVWVNDLQVEHYSDDCRGEEFCHGLVTFNLTKGKYSVKVKLENTQIRTLGEVITMFSFLLCTALFFRKETDKQA